MDTVRGPDAQWRFLKSVCLTLLSFDRLYQIAFRCRSLVAVAVSPLFTGVHVLARLKRGGGPLFTRKRCNGLL